MANETTYHTTTLNGKVSKRADTRQAISKEGNPFSRTTFRVTEDSKTRTNRDGSDYQVSEEWDLNIIGGDDAVDEQTNLISAVSDLEIGDNVEVVVAFLPRRYSQANIRVLSVRNSAQ